MATEIQYAFFKSIYDDENLRYTKLEARARFYLTIQTFYLGAIAFKFDDIQKFSNTFAVPLALFIAIGLLLVLGLLFTILSTRIRTYEAPTELLQLFKNSFESATPTDAAFLKDRLVDLAVATQRNCKVNDKVARLLSKAAWLLFTAIAVHFTTFVYAYIHQFKP